LLFVVCVQVSWKDESVCELTQYLGSERCLWKLDWGHVMWIECELNALPFLDCDAKLRWLVNSGIGVIEFRHLPHNTNPGNMPIVVAVWNPSNLLVIIAVPPGYESISSVANGCLTHSLSCSLEEQDNHSMWKLLFCEYAVGVRQYVSISSQFSE